MYGERLDRIERALYVIHENQRRILHGLRTITGMEELQMSEIDDLREGQEATNDAITRLGVSAKNAAERVQAKLDELVAAQGNSVTEADVADIRDDALALADIAGQIDSLAPADATTPPPVEPPVEPPVVDPEPQPVDGDGNPVPTPEPAPVPDGDAPDVPDVSAGEPVADTPVA